MAQATAPERETAPEQRPVGALPGGVPALIVGSVAALAVVVWLVATQGDARYLVNGDTYPGALTAYGAAAGRVIGTLSAALAFGALGYAVFRTRPQDGGDLGLRGYLVQLHARRYAAVAAIVSVPMVLLAASDSAGQNLIDTYRVGGLPALVSASESAKGWIVAVACEVIVLIGLRLALSWAAHLWLLIPAACGLLAGVVTANEAQGPNHDYSTAALVTLTLATGLWLGGLWSAARLPERTERRRLGPVFAAIVLIHAAVLALVYAPGADLPGTLYGRLYLASAVLVVAAAAAQFARRIVVAAAILTASVGTAISASLLTPPPFGRQRFTIGQVFMGYDLPEPPDALRLATLWRADLNFVLITAALVAGYLLALRRLRRSGGTWPWYRTVCFLVGCLALLVLTSSGVSTYAKAMFSVHMVAHMLMTSLVPVFLLLGAPVTLALATARGGPRRWLELALGSRSFVVLMRPPVQLLMFAVLLYGLYFTPLFDTIGRYHWGHLGINLALLVTGFLFYWRVFQIDPVPRELPFIGRIGMLLAMMPISMVFALIVMTMDSLVGSRLYLYLDLSWLSDLHRDQFVGGVAAWAADEAAIALVTLGLVLHWAWSNRGDESEPDLL